MTPLRIGLAIICLCYAATGIYVVRGNEQAVVRWFGKASPQLVGSGLRYALPWPFCRVTRVNLNETRTVTVGIGNTTEVDDNAFLKAPGSNRQSEYLTGDKNILHMQISVQFRIDDPRRFLLDQEDPERHLRFLVQTLVADLVSRSGVDYVHPLGLTALRQLLTQETRLASEKQGLGLFVEDVTLADVRPPISVKQAFLDVSNARAEKDRLLSEAQTISERLAAQANALASQLQDQAETHRAQQLSQASGEASRFNSLIDQFSINGKPGSTAYRQAADMARQRFYWTMLETLLPKLARNVYVDSDKPIDLTIQRGRKTTN
jgi:membrane protease subunit HflK